MDKRVVGIDLIPTQPHDIHKNHGGGEYAKRVFLEIAERVKCEIIICIYDAGRPLLPEIESLCNKKNFKLIGISISRDLDSILEEHGVQTFYSALPNVSKWKNSKSSVHYIFTIHGLRVIEMPTDRYEYLFANNVKEYVRYIYKQVFKEKYVKMQKAKFKRFFGSEKGNKTIVAPSMHTKYSIVVNYPEIKHEDISVLYSPRFEISPNMVVDINQEFNISSKNFILLILGSRWIKNNYRAIKAIDEVYSQNPDIKIKTLVLGVNKNKNVYKHVKNLEKFVFKGYVNSDILERLYKEAYLFVYPTLNEGFGYPPLEAMKYKTPVIASAISSVTEVCGDAALFFNPYSINEIKCRILQVINDKQTRMELKERGILRFEVVKERQQFMLDELVKLILS
jgi:glycosyltransferase involved in cell wall biosynthesis